MKGPPPYFAAGSEGERGAGGRGPRRKDAARSVWKAADGDEQTDEECDDEDDKGGLFHGQAFGVTLVRAMSPRTAAAKAEARATCSPVHASPKATPSAMAAWR